MIAHRIAAPWVFATALSFLLASTPVAAKSSPDKCASAAVARPLSAEESVQAYLTPHSPSPRPAGRPATSQRGHCPGRASSTEGVLFSQPLTSSPP